MIRINLLSIKRKKKKKQVPLPVVVTVLVTLIVVSAAGFYFYYLDSKVNKLTLHKKNNDARIAELNKRLAEVRNYEALKKKFEHRQQVIAQLRKNQSIPAKVLDELSRLLPDNVWLFTLKIEGKNINVKGTAFTNTEVVKYINNLKNAEMFVNVFLRQSRNKGVPTGIGQEKISVYDFQITMGIKA